MDLDPLPATSSGVVHNQEEVYRGKAQTTSKKNEFENNTFVYSTLELLSEFSSASLKHHSL